MQYVFRRQAAVPAQINKKEEKLAEFATIPDYMNRTSLDVQERYSVPQFLTLDECKAIIEKARSPDKTLVEWCNGEQAHEAIREVFPESLAEQNPVPAA